MSDFIILKVPLPPPSLRANSRAHWAQKGRDANDYSETVLEYAREQGIAMGQRWTTARADYEWRYASNQPDHGNLGGNVKYLQDILCGAPPMSVERGLAYKRTHLGIVRDDKGITANYDMTKVPHLADECVVVTIQQGESSGEARASRILEGGQHRGDVG